MGPARMLLVVGNLALAGLLVATHGSGTGGSRLHHDVAYGALVLATLASLPLLRRRRVTTLLLASTGAWSILTGLWLVYVTPTRGDGRWMEWWHGATSVAFSLAFLAHWARNNPRLGGLARRLAARRAVLLPFLAAWGLVVLAGLLTWRGPLRGLLSDRAFFHVTTLALVAGVVGVLYGLLALTSRRLEDDAVRNPLRGAVDLSLLASAWLALLTGLALLYFARALRAEGAYWPLAAWHVLVSVLLLALVAFHLRFNARPLAAHAR